MAPRSIDLQGIGKGFGGTEVLRDIDLSVQPGEFLSLVGMSGCGKSTLLRVIAGLETPDRGQVRIDGQDVTGTDPSDRDLAMVFQSYALYPHMSVRQNIATPLRMRRLSFAARLPLLGRMVPGRAGTCQHIDGAVDHAAEMLGIRALLERKPAQLSGGQRQRVALARALVRNPAAFLMDEPLSNLDAKLRAHMRDELSALHRRLGATFVYVTHDQVEAMTMSNRIALMDGGRIAQLGTPDALYQRPETLTVARFIGTPSINLVPVEIGADGAVAGLGRLLPLAAEAAPGPATLGLRAEDIFATTAAEGIEMIVERQEMQGADRFVTCHRPGEPGLRLVLRQPAAQAPAADALGRIAVSFAPARAHLFDATGRRCRLRLRAQVAA